MTNHPEVAERATPCGCTVQPLPPKNINQRQIQVAILFCDLHASAPLLATENAALRSALQRLVENFSEFPGEDTERWREEHEAYENAVAALNQQQEGE